MIKVESFWTEESQAPLLGLEKGYLKNEQNRLKAVNEIVKKWQSLVLKENDTNSSNNNNNKIIEGDIDENYSRIFIKDAERTFVKSDNRTQMIRVLTKLYRSFGDYSQSLGYVVSFLMLLTDEDHVVRMVTQLNFDPKYIPGYWKAEAVDFSRDAWVFQELLAKHHPKVAAHFLKNGIFPNTYAQKWFSGLCIHVLSFESLLKFFTQFFQDGHVFLFQFGLALVEVLQDPLLGSNAPNVIFELLRLDPKNKVVSNFPDLEAKILEVAFSGKYKDLGDLGKMREVAYETKVKPSLLAAQKRHQEQDSDDEIVFSDEEEEEDGDEKGGDSDEDLSKSVKKLTVKN